MEHVASESGLDSQGDAPQGGGDARRLRRDRLLRVLLVLVLAPCYARGLASDSIRFGDETYWTAHGWKAAQLLLAIRACQRPDRWPPMRFERCYLPAVAPIVAAECLALALLLDVAIRGGSRALRAFGGVRDRV